MKNLTYLVFIFLATLVLSQNAKAQISLTGDPDFGSVDKCDAVTIMYTLENAGGAGGVDLEIYGDIQVSGNSAFKVINQPTTSTLQVGESTTFEIEYTPTEGNYQSATVYISSSSDPYSFSIVGSGNPATYPDYEWEHVGQQGFSAENAQFHSLKIANGGTPYIAFQEGSSQKTSVMRYNSLSWEYVGAAEISTGRGSYQSLAIDNDENLYVAYQDGSNDNATTVLKYNGISWNVVGSAGISGITNEYQSIAVDEEGNVFVAFRNGSGKAKVMTFDTSTNSWENVGTDENGFSGGDVSYVDVAIDVNNNLFVVFKDESDSDPNNQGATIMTFDDGTSTWSDYNNLSGATSSFRPTHQSLSLDIYGGIYVAFQDDSGLPQVYSYSEGWFQNSSDLPNSSTAIGNIIIDLDERVYLCFQDQSNNNAASVMTSYYSNWQNVGDTDFAGVEIENINLALDKNGILYVAFSDLNNNGKTTVMHFLPSDDEPEINVQGNNQDIAFGSITTTIDNNTDFGTVGVTTLTTITYTIQNTGDLDLNIHSISISGDPSFSLNTSISADISEGDSITFDVTYSAPMSFATSTATVTINSSDCDERAYSFAIKATADVLASVMELYENTTLISNDGNSTFGNVFRCENRLAKTFTIKNDGNTNLDITGFSQSGSSDFTVVGLSSPISIPRQKSRNFTVTFSPSTTSPQTINIGINNTDINANPYSFFITGTGRNDTEAPLLVTMPNFVRNTDPTNCFFTNANQTTVNPIIPNGRADDVCRITSYSYVLSGATDTTLTSLTNARFEKGITRVIWSATDETGNTSTTDEFLVTIEDRRNPILRTPPSISVNTDLYSCIATASNLDLGEPTVSDNCLFRLWNNAPDEFPVGQTTVLWTARDSSGNISTAEQIVTVDESLSVTPSDSLILVQMYNEMGGQNWTRTWNLNEPASTWTGIGITCGKVSSINLSNNNLTGKLPNSVLNLTRRTELDFSLNIGGNRLLFTSAEDFVGQIPNFTYSPQAKIYASYREVIQERQNVIFSAATEGNFVSYQWYKNQTRINGATNPTFAITDARTADAGIYFCEIKNSVASRLILERYPINLVVQGFINPTDSLALVRIFEETGGRTSWRVRWDLTQPVSTWEGVTISGEKVIELDLSSNVMTGTLPDVFGAELFSELRYLSFFDNNLEGQIPSSIGNITTLTYLDLDKNNFEGTLPASFGNLINLKALWLSRNNLTELPDEIGNLTSLQNLYLNDNKFDQLPESIGNLSKLLVLNVSDNKLIGLPNSFTNLQKLIQFYANSNFIVALPALTQNLIALTIFEINTNNLSSLPTSLLQISSLKTLKVANNQLEFDDLLPFVNSRFIVFNYAPQAPINEEADILTATNSSVNFTITTQGNGNRYQWLKDGNSVSTLQNFIINRVRSRDAGFYTATITNPSLPNLMLQRRSIKLNVECQAGLNFEIKQPQQTIFCEGQPFGLKLAINEQFVTTSQIRWRKDGIILAFANEKNYTVTQAGIYTAEVITTNGCTALSNQIIIATLPKPEVTISLVEENSLESTINSQEAVTYQWLRDGNPIQDGFESAYTPTQTGEYSLLILTESGCSSVSEIIIFTTDEVTGIKEPKEFRNLELFPNPSNGNFFIDFGTNTPNGEPNFILIDAIGRKVNLKTNRISSTRYKVKTTNLAGGIYYLKIQTKDGVAFRKFVIEE